MTIQTNDIFRKTERGVAALKDRHLLADPKLRGLLIMVDGQRPVEKYQALGDVPAMMQSLADQGLVELAGAAAPVAAKPAPAATPAAPAAPRVSPAQLDMARKQAARMLLASVGPAGEAYCIKLEGARSAEELLTHLARAQALIANVKGEEAANRYGASIQALLA